MLTALPSQGSEPKPMTSQYSGLDFTTELPRRNKGRSQHHISIWLNHLIWGELLDLKKLTRIWWFCMTASELDISMAMNRSRCTCALSETEDPAAVGCSKDFAWNIKQKASCLESLLGHLSLQLSCELSRLLGVKLNKGKIIWTH